MTTQTVEEATTEGHRTPRPCQYCQGRGELYAVESPKGKPSWICRECWNRMQDGATAEQAVKTAGAGRPVFRVKAAGGETMEYPPQEWLKLAAAGRRLKPHG